MQDFSTEHYNISYDGKGTISIGFPKDKPATNDVLVKEVQEVAAVMKTDKSFHGKLLKFNGAASLPLAMVLCSNLAHSAPALAVYDPKLEKYVVVVTHSPKYVVGDIID